MSFAAQAQSQVEGQQSEGSAAVLGMNKQTARGLLQTQLPLPDRVLKRSLDLLCDIGRSASFSNTALNHNLVLARYEQRLGLSVNAVAECQTVGKTSHDLALVVCPASWRPSQRLLMVVHRLAVVKGTSSWDSAVSTFGMVGHMHKRWQK